MSQSLRQMACALLGVMVVAGAQAHVRQRYFLQTNAGEGQESIVHWDFSNPLRISMQNFAGNLSAGGGACNGSTIECINFSSARSVMGSSIAQWSGTLLNGLRADMNLDLSSGQPYAVGSGCEVTSSGESDGINNIVFASKKNDACSYNLNLGTIGLTRIRYSTSHGDIVEADIQFDDERYRFTTTGENDLTVSPKVINLRNVATHELGHFFGLDHSSVRDASMLFTVAEGLDTVENDDKLGLLSLYAPYDVNSGTGSAEGSLTYGSTPVFGGTVFALNARTLEVNASEMTDLNGGFTFCSLPPGPQIIFANRYRPYGKNIHEYYAGTGDSVTVSDENGCFNPGCTLMTQSLDYSWFSANAAAGLDLNIVGVRAGHRSFYINLAAKTSAPSMTAPPSTAPGAVLFVDQPRVARLGASNLSVIGGTTLGPQYFHFVANSTDMQVRSASLQIYARVKLDLDLLDSSGSALSGGESCTLQNDTSVAATVKAGKDPWLDCTGLSAGTTYVIKVSGTSASCVDIPGNSSSCDISGIEAASTPIPYYIVTVFPSADESSTASNGILLSSGFGGATRWQNFPTCGEKSKGIIDTSRSGDDSGGGCCGTLGGPGAPNPWHSFLLAILLSPFSWFLAWWGTRKRFGRR